MKPIYKLLVAVVLCLTLLMASCASLIQVANLLNCQFSMANVSDITWAGINMSNIHSVSDLSLNTLQKATQAIKNKDFNVSANINVNVKNQSSKPAKIFAFDYELFLENNPLASGCNKDMAYTINPQSTMKVPVPIQANIVQIIKQGQVGDVINFARNMMDYGNGKESNVKVKLTPYVGMGSDKKSVKLPTISLNKSFQ